MATRCIDISENRRIGAVSPIAMFVFVAIYIGLTAIMQTGVLYFVLVFISYVLTQIIFQYSPRYVFLTLKFLTKNSYLSPSFDDELFIQDEYQFEQIKKILPEED